MGYQACQRVVKKGEWISFTEVAPHQSRITTGETTTKSGTICGDTFETEDKARDSLWEKLNKMGNNCNEWGFFSSFDCKMLWTEGKPKVEKVKSFWDYFVESLTTPRPYTRMR